MESPDEQFEITQPYNLLAQRLGGLTPPILIPRLGRTREAHNRSMEAIDRAWELVGDLPIAAEHCTALRRAIIEWATLYVWVAIIEDLGATSLRAAAANAARARLQRCFQQLRKIES